MGIIKCGIKAKNMPILNIKEENGSVDGLISKTDLEGLKQVDIDKCDVSRLADLDSFSVNMDDNFYLRATQYFDFVKNPYVFRVGDTGVKINFNGDKKLRDSIKNIVIKSSSH